MFTNPKFWLLILLTLAILSFVALKVISLTGKKPERTGSSANLQHCPDRPNCVCSEDPRDSHNVAPIKFQGEATAAWALLRSVIESLGGKEVQSEERYLWFEFRTPLIGFTDDVECRLHQEASQIEIRSASRAGHSDLGANKKRVGAIREAFAKHRKRP